MVSLSRPVASDSERPPTPTTGTPLMISPDRSSVDCQGLKDRCADPAVAVPGVFRVQPGGRVGQPAPQKVWTPELPPVCVVLDLVRGLVGNWGCWWRPRLRLW